MSSGSRLLACRLATSLKPTCDAANESSMTITFCKTPGEASQQRKIFGVGRCRKTQLRALALAGVMAEIIFGDGSRRGAVGDEVWSALLECPIMNTTWKWGLKLLRDSGASGWPRACLS